MWVEKAALSSPMRARVSCEPEVMFLRFSRRDSIARLSVSIRACCTSAASCSSAMDASSAARSGLGSLGWSGLGTSLGASLDSDLTSVSALSTLASTGASALGMTASTVAGATSASVVIASGDAESSRRRGAASGRTGTVRRGERRRRRLG